MGLRLQKNPKIGVFSLDMGGKKCYNTLFLMGIRKLIDCAQLLCTFRDQDFQAGCIIAACSTGKG